MNPDQDAGRLSGVIFDVDGTLVDSERDGHRVAFNLAFSLSGLPYEWSPEVYGALLSTAGGRQRITGYLEQQGHSEPEAVRLADELHRLKTRFFEELVLDGAILLRPGARMLVDELRSAGIPLFVATTGTRSWVQPLLAHHFGNSTFDIVLTGTEVSVLKPAPDVYLELMRQAGLRPTGVVAVEDSRNGLRSAQAAGLACVVVPNQYTQGDISNASLVVSGFGPGAKWLAGSRAPLPDGRLAMTTLEFVAASQVPTEG